MDWSAKQKNELNLSRSASYLQRSSGENKINLIGEWAGGGASAEQTRVVFPHRMFTHLQEGEPSAEMMIWEDPKKRFSCVIKKREKEAVCVCVFVWLKQEQPELRHLKLQRSGFRLARLKIGWVYHSPQGFQVVMEMSKRRKHSSTPTGPFPRPVIKGLNQVCYGGKTGCLV